MSEKLSPLTVPADMHAAIMRISEETGMPIAQIQRNALQMYLEKQHGVQVENSVDRGGYRGKE